MTTPERRAEQAKHLKDDPFFQEQCSVLREYLIQELEQAELDGTDAMERWALERVRRLQSLSWMQKNLTRAAGHDAKVAEYREKLEEQKELAAKAHKKSKA